MGVQVDRSTNLTDIIWTPGASKYLKGFSNIFLEKDPITKVRLDPVLRETHKPGIAK